MDCNSRILDLSRLNRVKSDIIGFDGSFNTGWVRGIILLMTLITQYMIILAGLAERVMWVYFNEINDAILLHSKRIL